MNEYLAELGDIVEIHLGRGSQNFGRGVISGFLQSATDREIIVKAAQKDIPCIIEYPINSNGNVEFMRGEVSNTSYFTKIGNINNPKQEYKYMRSIEDYFGIKLYED